MKKFATLILLLITVLSSAAQFVDYKLNVQNFCELKIVDGIEVDYYCRDDSAGWAIFTCPPGIASKIMFSNENECLSIQTDADEETITDVPVIKVYSAALRKVENCGDSTVCVHSLCPVNEFSAKVVGNGLLEVFGIDAPKVNGGITAGKGTLRLHGHAHNLTVKNIGAGPIDASDLAADEVKCYMFGSGSVDCNPTNQLKIYGAGSGAVHYKGSPTKITNRGIGVKAIAKDQEKLITQK